MATKLKVKTPRLNTPMARAFFDHIDAKKQKVRQEQADGNFTIEFNENFN